jgi:hypothetical protein
MKGLAKSLALWKDPEVRKRRLEGQARGREKVNAERRRLKSASKEIV